MSGTVRTEISNIPAIIYLMQNNNGNIEYKAEIQQEDEIEITAESKGYSYKKFLCMAFDVAVLMTYADKSFFRFVYHDGALEGLDDRKKINFVNKVREICDETGKHSLSLRLPRPRKR